LPDSLDFQFFLPDEVFLFRASCQSFSEPLQIDCFSRSQKQIQRFKFKKFLPWNTRISDQQHLVLQNEIHLIISLKPVIQVDFVDAILLNRLSILSNRATFALT